jgi:hypothetical protein
MILEYKDEEALGVREETSNKVRAKLRENPEWKADPREQAERARHAAVRDGDLLK